VIICVVSPYAIFQPGPQQHSVVQLCRDIVLDPGPKPGLAAMQAWQKARLAEIQAQNAQRLEYDWTYTTPYSGTVLPSAAVARSPVVDSLKECPQVTVLTTAVLVLGVHRIHGISYTALQVLGLHRTWLLAILNRLRGVNRLLRATVQR